MEGEWTDKRMDDFADRVDRFEANVDRRFDKVDQRFDRLESRMDNWGRIVAGAAVTIVAGVIAKLFGA